MSGETYSPHHIRSSPVFTTSVMSSAGMTWRRPSTNFAPPVPPLRTQIMLPSEPVRRRPSLHAIFRREARVYQSYARHIPDRPATVDAAPLLWLQYASEAAPGEARAFPD